MSVYKRFCFGFAWAFVPAILGFVVLLFLLWLYDPFQFFHKPIFREITYHSDMRMQAKGIIDNTDFDSVILGTSMLENTSAKEASTKLGGKWVNLSIAGGSFEDRAIMLTYLFKRKNIKSIVYSIDTPYLLNEYKVSIKSELYKDSPFLAKYKFYLDEKFIKCAIKWSKSPECVGKKELETILQWHLTDQEQFKGFIFWSKVMKKQAVKYLKIYEKGEVLPPYDKEKMQEYVRKYVFELVAENPQINFYFIIPTYQRLAYKFPIDSGYPRWSKQIKEMFVWFVNEGAKYKNARIYGFDDTNYPDTFANYKDLQHYNVDMNSMQLDAIADGTHILTPQNIDEYLQTMENKIKAYDLTPLINEIKAWEAEQNATAKE